MKSEFWDEQYEVGSSPSSWVHKACNLKHAADLVFEAYSSDLEKMVSGANPKNLKYLEVVGPTTLLYGLAFENLFKAIIIKIEGTPIKNGRLKQWNGSGHGLIQLAEQANVKLTSAQRDLLLRFTAFIEWSGRYPIPKSKLKMGLIQDGFSSEWFPIPIQLNELTSVNELFQTLIDRI